MPESQPLTSCCSSPTGRSPLGFSQDGIESAPLGGKTRFCFGVKRCTSILRNHEAWVRLSVWPRRIAIAELAVDQSFYPTFRYVTDSERAIPKSNSWAIGSPSKLPPEMTWPSLVMIGYPSQSWFRFQLLFPAIEGPYDSLVQQVCKDHWVQQYWYLLPLRRITDVTSSHSVPFEDGWYERSWKWTEAIQRTSVRHLYQRGLSNWIPS